MELFSGPSGIVRWRNGDEISVEDWSISHKPPGEGGDPMAD